jgi:uncharacterized membrane protein YhaH (DUF805 family)
LEPVRAKEPDHRRRIVNASLTVVGVASAALIAITSLVYFVEYVVVHGRESPLPLPPPTDRRIVAVAVVTALVIALFAAGRCVRRAHDADFNPWTLTPFVVLVLIALLFVT